MKINKNISRNIIKLCLAMKHTYTRYFILALAANSVIISCYTEYNFDRN